LHRDRKFRPELVIIGVDAWLWDPGHWKQYWWPLHKEYFRLTADWGINLHRGWSPAAHASRYYYYRVGFVWKRWQLEKSHSVGNPFYYATNEEFVGDYLKRCDGSVGYHAGFRNREPAKIEQVIRDSRK